MKETGNTGKEELGEERVACRKDERKERRTTQVRKTKGGKMLERTHE